VSSLREQAPQADIRHVPTGGLNLWVRLPDGTDVDLLADHCERNGLVIAPGSEWFPAEPAGPLVRPDYAGPDPAAFPAGARILGRALARSR
jgi:DNA-binding transcriptional MocR family regulator